MLNAADWTAIGTSALAVGTFVLAWVTVRTSTTTRRHDDEKRAEDRAADASKRAEDRARDDRLREEAREQAEQHERAERVAREDFEARQVLVTVEVKEHLAEAYWERYLGWPDLVSWRETPEGSQAVQFIEVKSSSDRLSDDQRMWIQGNHDHLQLDFRMVKVHRTQRLELPMH